MQYFAAEIEEKKARVWLSNEDVTAQTYAADDANGWVDEQVEKGTTGARFTIGNSGEIWLLRRFGIVRFELPGDASPAVETPAAGVEYIAQALIFHSRLRTYFQPGEAINLDHLPPARVRELLADGYVKVKAPAAAALSPNDAEITPLNEILQTEVKDGTDTTHIN